MNLSEREQRFLDELYRVFPDAHEVKATAKQKEEAALMRVLGAPVAVFFDEPVQVSLFGQEG